MTLSFPAGLFASLNPDTVEVTRFDGYRWSEVRRTRVPAYKTVSYVMGQAPVTLSYLANQRDQSYPMDNAAFWA